MLQHEREKGDQDWIPLHDLTFACQNHTRCQTNTVKNVLYPLFGQGESSCSSCLSFLRKPVHKQINNHSNICINRFFMFSHLFDVSAWESKSFTNMCIGQCTKKPDIRKCMNILQCAFWRSETFLNKQIRKKKKILHTLCALKEMCIMDRIWSAVWCVLWFYSRQLWNCVSFSDLCLIISNNCTLRMRLFRRYRLVFMGTNTYWITMP